MYGILKCESGNLINFKNKYKQLQRPLIMAFNRWRWVNITNICWFSKKAVEIYIENKYNQVVMNTT